MIEKIEIRKRLGKEGPSQTKMRNDAWKIHSHQCAMCHTSFERIYISTLDHIFPICMGGLIYELDNWQLLCHTCHKIKTHIDMRIYHLLRKLGVIERQGYYSWKLYLPISKIREIYFFMFSFIQEKEGEIMEQPVGVLRLIE